MPVRLIDIITTEWREKRLSPSEVERHFLSFYSSEVVNSLLETWRHANWLTGRLPVLEEAIANYDAARHFSCVCLLLPQIEGILGDHLGRKPNAQNDAASFFRHTRLGVVAREFYVRIYCESVRWDADSPIPELSRNAILHGRIANYGTAKHSLKLILILDAVLGALREAREARGADA